jgi:hypothetical protein
MHELFESLCGEHVRLGLVVLGGGIAYQHSHVFESRMWSFALYILINVWGWSSSMCLNSNLEARRDIGGDVKPRGIKVGIAVKATFSTVFATAGSLVLEEIATIVYQVARLSIQCVVKKFQNSL